MTATLTYPVTPRSILDLHDIGAPVIVTASKGANGITVAATGPEAFLELVKTRALTTGGNPTVRVTAPGGRGGVNVTGSGSVTVIGGGWGNSGIVIGSGTQHNVSASGGQIVFGHSGGGRIVVNGVDVTDAVNNRSAAEPQGPAPKIEITVPEGIRIRVAQCAHATVYGLRTPMQAKVTGQDKLHVRDAEGLHLTVSGQATARATGITGQVILDVSGQAHARVDGADITDVEAHATGQAKITLDGRATTVTGSVAGQAGISIEADVAAATGPDITVTAQGTARYKGRALGAARTGVPRWSW